MNQRRILEFALVLVVVALGAMYLAREPETEQGMGLVAIDATPVENVTPRESATFADDKAQNASPRVSVSVDFDWDFPDPAVFDKMPAATMEMAREGRVIFSENCASCHGEFGKGDGAAAAALDPKPTDLTSFSAYKHGPGQRQIAKNTAFGIEGTGMAPFGGILSTEEIWKVTSFVRFELLKIRP